MNKIKHDVIPATKEKHTFTVDLTVLEVRQLIIDEVYRRLKVEGLSYDNIDRSDDFSIVAKHPNDHISYHKLHNPKVTITWTELK